MADATNNHPEACLIYSDEDKLTPWIPTDPHSNRIGLALARASFVSQLTVFRADF